MTSRARDSSSRNRAAILDAAMRLFAQYGYRRTSIDDIARAAEIAKGTVYLSFTSKEEVFRALCAQLIERVEAEAERARRLDGPIEERLDALLEAKFGFYFETVHRSAHAAELMDSKGRLSADLFEKSDRRYQRLVRELIEEAAARGEIAPARAGLDAAEATELILAAAHGIEFSVASPAAYHRRLRELVRVMVAGL
ncbi:MAG TPA: helix-turn-helix domain-containing protein, partial [Candidatus Binataceae bacterium]|nr:helix-turn-helix domain-containing protein [Candidatus Binataceae bacterium]